MMLMLSVWAGSMSSSLDAHHSATSGAALCCCGVRSRGLLWHFVSGSDPTQFGFQESVKVTNCYWSQKSNLNAVGNLL